MPPWKAVDCVEIVIYRRGVGLVSSTRVIGHAHETSSVLIVRKSCAGNARSQWVSISVLVFDVVCICTHAINICSVTHLHKRHMHTHTLSHTHTLTLSHTQSHTHSLTLTLTLTHSHTHTLTHSYTHTHAYSRHTHTHSLSLTLTHSHTHTLTRTLTVGGSAQRH